MVPTATIGRRGAGGVDRGGGLGADFTALGVDAVGRDVVVADGEEGAGADMQGDGAPRTPRAASAASRSGVKCRPAVGAATAPAVAANTVW